MTEPLKSPELQALLGMGRAGVAAGAKDVDHLDGAAAAFNYVRIADLVESYCKSNSTEPILDWGCGYGQVSWLLQHRGLPVVSCDVERRPARDSIELLNRVHVDYLQDPLRLPYESASFGSVLSVGVLEHVGAENVEPSLKEISRVLKPGGFFFIFMLPNKFSWVEFIADVRGLSVHPDKYTFNRIEALLNNHSFVIQAKWRRNVLPRNLTGLSRRAKSFYGRYYRQIEAIDYSLSRLFPFSNLCGVIEVIAKQV